MHDGSVVNLHKLNQAYDPRNRREAFDALQAAQMAEQILTGLIYIDPDSQELHDTLQTSRKPLRSLNESELCPGSQALETINDSLR